MTNSALRLHSADRVRAGVDALSNGHPVTRVDGGREPVWRIAPRRGWRRRSTATRSSTRSWKPRSSNCRCCTPPGLPMASGSTFWAQAMRLRSLLKFDFYFADSATFRKNIAEVGVDLAGKYSLMPGRRPSTDLLLRANLR